MPGKAGAGKPGRPWLRLAGRAGGRERRPPAEARACPAHSSRLQAPLRNPKPGSWVPSGTICPPSSPPSLWRFSESALTRPQGLAPPLSMASGSSVRSGFRIASLSLPSCWLAPQQPHCNSSVLSKSYIRAPIKTPRQFTGDHHRAW